jgi:hypothetical protein
MVEKMGKIHLFVDISVEFHMSETAREDIFYFVHFLWVLSFNFCVIHLFVFFILSYLNIVNV